MATNGHEQAFAPVIAALATMQSSGDRAQKGQAHEYLEQFQKSVSTPPIPLTSSSPYPNQARPKHGRRQLLFYTRQMPPHRLSCSPLPH